MGLRIAKRKTLKEIKEEINKFFFSYHYEINEDLSLKNPKLPPDKLEIINKNFYIEEKNGEFCFFQRVN